MRYTVTAVVVVDADNASDAEDEAKRLIQHKNFQVTVQVECTQCQAMIHADSYECPHCWTPIKHTPKDTGHG